MKSILSIFCFLVVLITPINVYASDISAQSCIVMDMDSGVVIFEKNAYSPMEMASTTKIMTCLLACESGKLNDVVDITTEMLDGTYGSLIYLNVGDRITLVDLVRGAMLQSGNDAANSIAVYLGGNVDNFIKMMNDRAEKIGMTDTVFVTPSGLDKDNHHSTAYDMALLGSVAIKNETLSSICSLKSCDITINNEKRTLYNHNKLLGFDGFVGLKTGYTDKAGRCLVSAYEFDENTIITVTLNAPNDWDDHKKMVEEAKEKYVHYSNSEDIDVDVVGGNFNKVKCKFDYDIVSINDVSIKCYYYPFLYAPICIGDKVGIAKIYKENELIKTVEITATEDIELWQITM